MRVISMDRCPSSAAIASRRMPRLIAWVARVWRSWWMDFHFAGPPDAPDNASDLVTVQRSAVVGGKTPMAADVLQVGGGPGGKQLDELGVERHVAVVAELAERDAQPVALADAHDRVGVL